MDYAEAKKRLLAAQEILSQPSVSAKKLAQLATLIKGFNPKLDQKLAHLTQAWAKLEKLKKGEVVELTAEALSEDTPQRKKRKKLLLAFIKLWKDLKSEVARVQGELTHTKEMGQLKITTWGRILTAAKGPLGVITLLAIAWVYLQSIAVSVVIKTAGCETIQPRVSMPVSIAGLKLPQEPIPSGGQGIATLPPFTFSVDGTSKGFIRLKALGISLTYELASDGIDVFFNGSSLIGKQTTIALSERPQHELLIRCSGGGPSGVACTMEVKQCPDGSYVGRVGPRCEFAPCPGGKK